MFTFCVLASVTAAAGSVPMAFLFPDQLEDASNVVLAPRFPESTAVLVAADPSRPKLWYSPAAVWSGDGEDLVWYQRVDKGEKEYMDQRVLCAAWIRNGEWSLPALRPGSPVWGGPDNVAMRRSPHKPTWGGFNVFQIVREGDRFRMLYWDQPATGEAGAMLAESADGLSWTTDARGTVFVEHNDAFTLLPKDGAYLLYQTKLEDWPDKPYADNLDKMRRVQTIRESKDLVTWTPQEVFLRPDEQDSPITEFYLMKAFPYAQGYAGLLMKYCADPAKPKEHSGIVATELVVSHDARAWQRPFRDTDLVFWAYTAPFVREGKLHFVVGKTGAIEQLTYRPRRLTGVAAHGATDGVFVTQPFAMPATDLAIDADTSSGWIEVEALDTEKTSTEGFGPARVEKVDGEVIPLVWEGLRSLDLPLAECRLRFKLHNATLYAITTMSESNAEETPSES